MKKKPITCRPIGDCKTYCSLKPRPCETDGITKIAVMDSLFEIDVIDIPNGVAAGHKIIEYLNAEDIMHYDDDYSLMELEDLEKLKSAVKLAIEEMKK